MQRHRFVYRSARSLSDIIQHSSIPLTSLIIRYIVGHHGHCLSHRWPSCMGSCSWYASPSHKHAHSRRHDAHTYSVTQSMHVPLPLACIPHSYACSYEYPHSSFLFLQLRQPPSPPRVLCLNPGRGGLRRSLLPSVRHNAHCRVRIWLPAHRACDHTNRAHIPRGGRRHPRHTIHW